MNLKPFPVLGKFATIMKSPTLTDVIRRTHEAHDFFSLSASDKELLVFGIIRVWNDRRRPKRFPCKQALLLGFAGMKEGSFKKSRKKLSDLELIIWEEGERNVRTAIYSLGSWFYDDHESNHESVSDSDRESAPYYRGREREREENTPIVPKGTVWAPNDLQIQINSWFSRRDSTRWSEKEIRAFRKNASPTDSEDIGILDSYYSAEIQNKEDIRRRDIGTLLNNWTGEIDRARRFQKTVTEVVGSGEF